jgi:hypothetical protein
MAFYFAWVDKTDTVFNPVFAREDEQVFALSLEHSEGDFAALDIDLKNPRVGLLAPARKQWAWLTYRKQDDTLVPLFFGRLIGVPQQMQDEVVRLSFVARPVDFEDQKLALAETLREAPYYDEAFLSVEERLDPDRVLEGRSALWHIDRLTGEVTISDIVTGEDGQIDFDEAEAIYDSVEVSYSTSPASRCEVTAEVTWAQTGSGDIDITQQILTAFAGLTLTGLTAIDGTPRPTSGVINVVGGPEMMSNWPKFGDAIGGGWTVGHAYAHLVGDPPLPPILEGGIIPNLGLASWLQSSFAAGPPLNAIRQVFNRSPGFVVGIKDLGDPVWTIANAFTPSSGTILWVNAWQIAPKLALRWDASRSRKETLTFTVTADVQPLLTDPGEEEVIRLLVGPVDVDDFIHDARSSRYFSTDRGQVSLTHLLARARANLLNRARAIDVSFEVPFESALDVTLRKSASIQDPRLPGGVAAGKIKAYRLAVDGDTGKLVAGLTIGCSVGRDGDVTVVEGEPVYVADGYVDSGYQVEEDAVAVPFAGDLGYSLDTYSANDDGVNLYGVNAADYLTSLTVAGGIDTAKAAVASADFDSPVHAMDTINGVKTTVRLTLRPVSGGPFEAFPAPTVTDLKIPRTIDLE